MRKPLIAANWKMNNTPAEAITLVKQMLPELDASRSVETLICPPFISLVVISELIRDSCVMLGAQNAYYEDKGAFTGEVSPLMLSGWCQYVILGHSERRSLFGESSQIVSKKVKAAFKANLKPILCVGENLADNDGGRTEEVVTSQIEQSLDGIRETPGLVVAYEPVWAIGTGRAASGVQANSTIKMIRDVLADLLGKPQADATRILYGGSANAANIAEFIGQPEIDGALAGGASLKATEFISMVRQAASIKGCG
jgi:triosephosphate isomerase (TIM)